MFIMVTLLEGPKVRPELVLLVGLGLLETLPLLIVPLPLLIVPLLVVGLPLPTLPLLLSFLWEL